MIDREQCAINQVHPGGRVHAAHMDTDFKVPRELTLPHELTKHTFTFPVIKRQTAFVEPIATVGRPESADYTVQHWAFRVWRVHSVHRCDRCGDILEVGSYLSVHLYTLSEEPLVAAIHDDGSVAIE